MGAKEEVSKNYIESMKAQHASKPLKQKDRGLLITGDARPQGIGAAVRKGLPESLYSSTYSMMEDIRVKDAWVLPEAINDFDTLIMCHGAMHLDWFEEYPEELIWSVIGINLTGTALLAQEFVRRTINNPWRKQIIIIGSMAHKSVLNGSAIYCASKAGVNMLAKCLAWELAPKGYDVYCINPSNTEGTAMTEETIAGLQRYRNMTREQAESYWASSLPKNRWLQPYDISKLVNFLVSGSAEYLSGACIDMAGGQR